MPGLVYAKPPTSRPGCLPRLKRAIDLMQPGEEREVQQLIFRDNNLRSIARSTDYYVFDIE